MLHLLATSSHERVRDAAEVNISEILRKSPNPEPLVEALAATRDTTYKPEALQAIKRLTSFAELLPTRKK